MPLAYCNATYFFSGHSFHVVLHQVGLTREIQATEPELLLQRETFTLAYIKLIVRLQIDVLYPLHKAV